MSLRINMDLHYLYTNIDNAIYKQENTFVKANIDNFLKFKDSKFQISDFLPTSLQSKNVEIFNFLLEKGADVNFLSSLSNYSPVLSDLIVLNRDRANNNANKEETIEIADESVQNILKESADMIKLLIEKGADINKPDGNGFTPLDIAHQNDHQTAFEILLKLGAKFSQRHFNEYLSDENKKYFNIIENDCIKTEWIDKTMPMLHTDIEKEVGCKINFNKNIDLKRISYHVENIRNLDINQKDWKGRTALDYAIELEHDLAIEYLEKHGAKRASEL